MLDDLMPRYDFAERHRRRVRADPDRTWTALAGVTLADLTVTRPLVALRHLGRRPDPRPLLTHGPLPLLMTEPGRAVAGTVAQPWRPRPRHREVSSVEELNAFTEPGWTKYLTEFRVEPAAGGCVLSTETRGTSTDGSARRRFRAYWTLIRIPSGIVRRDVLRVVARRAECG